MSTLLAHYLSPLNLRPDHDEVTAIAIQHRPIDYDAFS